MRKTQQKRKRKRKRKFKTIESTEVEPQPEAIQDIVIITNEELVIETEEEELALQPRNVVRYRKKQYQQKKPT